MKKPKNGSGDEFDFMDGGMDEFFPLENPGSSSSTPPKGVKGYLKNVAKSVMNLGVKVGKSLYPDVVEFGSQFKEIEDGSGNSFDPKATINKYVQKGKNIYSEGVKVAKDIGNDIKTAVKTGYFVKSDEESMDLEGAFGDLMDLGDMGDFGSDFDDYSSSDDNGDDTPKRKGRITAGEATIKSSVASTKAILRSNQKQRAAIVGAAQSHIMHETELFSQQLQLSQYQHRQKMLVMKNIATNLGKVINQNNIKLRAQMEYSAKSLAFTQDISAMLKETRGALFKMVQSSKKDEEIEDSPFKQAFGSNGTSFNVNKYIKQIKSRISNNTSLGQGFDMLKTGADAIKMMTDMGMSKSSAIKQMMLPMLLESGLKGMLTGKTAQSIDALNFKAQGLGTAFNKQMGKIASGDNALLNKFVEWGNKKGGMFSTIANFARDRLQDVASTAYIHDQAQFRSDRFKMGDPDTVHPFDNKAHKALTEVIPAYLSKISAGVNHTEEQVFDYANNKFISSKALVEEYGERKRLAYEETRNIDVFKDNFFETSSGDSTFNFEEIADDMMRNWLRYSMGFDKSVLEKVLYKNHRPGEYSHILLNGILIEHLKDRELACKKFYEAIDKMRPKNESDSQTRLDWSEFVTSASTYNNRMGDNMLDYEEEVSKNVSSIQHTLISNNDGVKNELRNIDRTIALKKKLLANIKGNDKRALEEKNRLNTEIRELNAKKSELKRSALTSVSNINDNLDSVEKNFISFDENTDDFNKFRISSLADDTTHGLVQNIYNLLLSGIDVYTTPKEQSPETRNKYISSTKTSLVSKLQSKRTERSATEIQNKYVPFDTLCPKDLTSKDFEDFLYKNDITNSDGQLEYTGKLYWIDVKTNKMVGESAKKMFENRSLFANCKDYQFYFSISEQQAYRNNKWRKDRLSDQLSFDDDRAIYKVPVIGKFAKAFDAANRKVSDIGNKVLGNMFYGEDNELLSKQTKMTNELKNIKVGNKTLEETVKETNDTALLSLLKDTKNPRKQAEYILKEVKFHPEFEPFTQSLKDFINQPDVKFTNDVKFSMSTLGKNLKDKFKNKVNEKLEPAAKALLGGKLATMKVGKYHLAQAILDTGDVTIKEFFKKEKDPLVKAKYIKDKIKDYPEQLSVFSEPLNEFITKLESSEKSLLGTTSTLVLEKFTDIKNKLVSKGKEKLNPVLQKFMLNKQGAKLFNIKVEGKSLSNLFFTNKNVMWWLSARNKELAETAKKENKNIYLCYAEELLKCDIPEIQPYKPGIQDFITNFNNLEKSNDVLGSLKTKASSVVDKVMDKALSLVDKFITGKDHKTGNKLPLISPKLAAIEGLNGVKLGDVINEIAKESGEEIIIRGLPGDLAKAVYLSEQVKSDKLEPFIKPLKEFVEENKQKTKDGIKTKISDVSSTVKTKVKETTDKLSSTIKTNIIDKGKAKLDEKFDGDFNQWVKDKGIELKDLSTEKFNELRENFKKTKETVKDKSVDLKDKAKDVVGDITDKVRSSGFKDKLGGTVTAAFGSIGDVITKFFNKKDAVEGDSVVEQIKLKKERRKEKQEREERKERKNLFKMAKEFFTRNKDGIKLDDDQAGEIISTQASITDAVNAGSGSGMFNDLLSFIKKPSLKSGVKFAGKGVGKLFKGLAKGLGKVLTNPAVLGTAAAAAGAIALGTAGKKAGNKFGDRTRQYKNLLHDDQEGWGLNNNAYNDAKQGEDIGMTTGAITGAMAGKKALEVGGKYVNKGKSNLLLKAAEGAEKKGWTKMSDKMLNKAAKAEARSNKFGAKASKGSMGKFTTMAMGALGGATVGSAVAEKMGLEGNAATAVTVAGGVAGTAASGPIMKILNSIRDKAATKIGESASTAITKIGTMLTKNLGKFGAKLGGVLAKITASAAALIVKVAWIVIKIVDGMTVSTTKKNFSLSKGTSVTWGMRLASGLWEGLDSALCGLLGMLTSLIGYPSGAAMLYDWIGPEAERNALARYQDFMKDRAKLYGVTRDQLVAYEQRYQEESGWGKAKNAVKGAVRGIGSAISGFLAGTVNFFAGKEVVKSDFMVKDNDGYAASLLGFVDKEIYVYWKSNKYDPLEEQSANIAAEICGSAEAFNKLMAPGSSDLDENGDGNVTQDDLDKSETYKALENQTKARVKILENMKKYILDNKLAWLTNELTLEDFRKYSEGVGQFKTQVADQTKREKRSQEQQAKIEKLISTGSGASVLDKINMTKEERQQYNAQFNTNKERKWDDFKKSVSDSVAKASNWIKSKYKEYKFNKKEENVMNSATAAIQAVHKNVDPTFYGDNPASGVDTGGVLSENGNERIVNVGGNGGPETFGTNAGYFVRVKDEKVKSSPSKLNVTPKQKPNQNQAKTTKETLNETYDMSGAVPKSTVMNSIVEDFAKNFGNELTKRLNILEEMHKENLRHNKVTEDFFTACLAMMAQIAKSSGNNNMGVKLDAMISQIIR